MSQKLLKRAIKDRYVHIDKKRDRLTYLPQGKERVLSNPEETVQLNTYLHLIYRQGYPVEKLRVCEKVKIGSSTREADIVVFRDADAKDPYIIVECKKEKVSNRVFEEAIDQGFSYAAVTNAEYVWATSGDRDAYFEVWDDAINERERNRLPKIPRHKEKKGIRHSVRKRLRWFYTHPVMSDTLLYGIVIFLCVTVFSKVAVEYNSELYREIKPYWNRYGMDFNWIYNVIIGISTIMALIFGGLFMQSHQLFQIKSSFKKLSYSMIALILFVPSWYMGISNDDPNWWTWGHYATVSLKTKIYLWPYLKSFPFQMAAIFGLIWLISRSRKLDK
ncbi:MAG: type I restriction enzyme HsdR N-terminal domain-containing protein [Bacteroidota bacterium]